MCQGVVPPRTKAQRVVLTRRKKYPYRSQANTFVRLTETGKRKTFHTDDPGGEGEEIVKEVLVCPDCARRNGQK
jgi:hypothetical protein